VQWLLGVGRREGASESMNGWEEVLAAPLTEEEEILVKTCHNTRPELPGVPFPPYLHELWTRKRS